MIGETVVRLRPTAGTDRYGNPEPDWGDADAADIDGCVLAPRLDPEDRDQGRQGVVIGWTVYAPHGGDILATDRLRIRGDDHEVDGEPGDWRSPFTCHGEGLEVQTRRVVG